MTIVARNVLMFDSMLRRTSDRVLEAVPATKFAAGTLWQGDLKPRLDYLVGEIETLVSGFTAGEVLSPEGPGQPIDMGAVWKGISALEQAVRDARVALAVAQDRSTSDSRIRDTPARVGSFSQPTSPAQLNAKNKAFWEKQTATADKARSPAEAPAAASSIASINEQNRKFWTGR